MPRRRQKISIRYPRDPETAGRVASVAEEANGRYGLDGDAERWKPYAVGTASAGGRDMPVLALDDYSEIPFVRTVVGAPWYQYRARLRCGDGDCYAVARPAVAGYEAYNREHLGLGRTRLLRLEPAGTGLELAARLNDGGPAFDGLCESARRAGGLLVHPYMGIEPVWQLAAAIAAAAHVRVEVLAPFPRVTRLANDKACFSEMVEALLGGDALTGTFTSSDPRELAELLGEAAARHEAVALKMPSCASGMGNRIFEGASLRGRRTPALRNVVDRFLEDKEWDGRETVLVVQWHRDVIESPSTQCWIPPPTEGEPQVEEVYQQFLIGDQQVFEGAMLSGLPRAIRHDFMTRSWLLCRVLQQLGYVGRCSFDALVVGRDIASARVKFVECNGRWGGTSMPMHLMKRVFGDFRLIPYKAQDYVDERLCGLDFHQLVDIFGDSLYDRRTGRGRVLLYNVGGVGEHGKFDMVVTGRTYADIGRFIDERVPALITRYVRGRRARQRQATFDGRAL